MKNITNKNILELQIKQWLQNKSWFNTNLRYVEYYGIIQSNELLLCLNMRTFCESVKIPLNESNFQSNVILLKNAILNSNIQFNLIDNIEFSFGEFIYTYNIKDKSLIYDEILPF